MSVYLSDGDLAGYGIPNATSAQIGQASALIDGYLSRPEGLLFTADPRGSPCYMTGSTASGQLELAAAVAPGLNVSVAVTGWVTPDLVGEMVIADRAGQTPAPEALVITAVAGQVVTFASVLANHASGAILETGMVLYEERSLPAKRPIARISRSPIVRLLSGMGRYGFGRRSQQFAGFPQPDLIAVLAQFGSTPPWIPFDVTQAAVSPRTDEVYIPAGLYLDSFSDVRLRYVAGYPTPPTPVKQVCASLVQTIADFPEMASNVLTLQAGGTVIKRGAASLLSDEMKSSLAPFEAHLFY